eukprot:GHVL01032784.1.p2 GENE.GHVL01032784.1~~GHVL01032784.1.p2  ORF type:complete len:168 (+),score=28.72 GHVL01032784.1:57-560(+)
MPKTPSKGYAVKTDKGPLESWDFERREIQDEDVFFKVTYSGVCHSDIHVGRNEWAGQGYNLPLVPGHEIAGVVEAVGKSVTKFKKGDLVGAGPFIDSCRRCAACDKGDEVYCQSIPVAAYNAKDRYGDITQGGYSTNYICAERYIVIYIYCIYLYIYIYKVSRKDGN